MSDNRRPIRWHKLYQPVPPSRLPYQDTLPMRGRWRFNPNFLRQPWSMSFVRGGAYVAYFCLAVYAKHLKHKSKQ
jgi:hypothetical protein